MYKTFFTLFMITLVTTNTNGVAGSKNAVSRSNREIVNNTCGKYKVPEELVNAISTYYPGYKLVTYADFDKDMTRYLKQEHEPEPCAWLKADFDGNKEQDYVVSLYKVFYNTYTWTDVIFLKNKHKFISVEIDRDKMDCDLACQKNGVEAYFELVPPGTTVKEFEGFTGTTRREATLKLPGIRMNIFERSSRVIFWDSSKKKFDCIYDED